MTTPLRAKLVERISREGPITFYQFMRAALYDPDHGFYATRAPGAGAGAGYRTSPTLTPAFGKLIGRALHALWKALGRPDEFVVIEPGGGGGDLAASVAAALPEELNGRTTWVFIEPFEHVRSFQIKRTEASGISVRWAASLKEVRAETGCVIANEVLDNFPVRAFQVARKKVLEVFVDSEGEHLIERLGPPSVELDPDVLRIAAGMEEGDRFESRPDLREWFRQVAGALTRGYLLVIDYGDFAPDLWVKRPGGTLTTYRGELMGEHPLDHPGEVDITAHVDFSELEQAARSAGMQPDRTVTQREFLKELGIDDIESGIRNLQQAAHTEGRHADALSLLAERGRLHALTAAGGMGDFLVFVARKDAPPHFC